MYSYWQESVAGVTTRNPPSAIASRSDGTWNVEARFNLPFVGHPHEIVATDDDQLDVYWIGTNSDLFHKRVGALRFSSPNAWGTPSRLDRSVVAFDATVDGRGGLHVVYLKVEEDGVSAVQYQRSLNGGATWSLPDTLYASDYLRRFATGDSVLGQTIYSDRQSFHLNVMSATQEEESVVLVGWDVPPLKRVFISTSSDRGESWTPAAVFDGPQDDDPYASPGQIRFFTHDSTILALWDVVEAGGSCSIATRVSTDLAATWSDLRMAPAGISACPQAFDAIGDTSVGQLFFVSMPAQSQLVAWDGEKWSLPQPQDGLANFVDEETLDFIEFGCQEIGLQGDELIAIGCDLAGGSDVWATQRTLGDVSAWFDTSTGWSQERSAVLDDLSLGSMSTAVDRLGNLHVVWTQIDLLALPEPESALYHGYWSGDLVGPIKVLSGLPGVARDATMVITPSEKTFAVWSGGVVGELFYSTSSAVSAGSSSGWFEPARVLPEGSIGWQPSAVVDLSGGVVVAYVVPINEGRGVYSIVWNEDDEAWLEPVRVFDASARDCPVAADPSIFSGESGILHIVWTCNSLQEGSAAVGMYYSRSLDGGQSWEAAVEVSRGSTQGGDIGQDSAGTLHLIWQVSQGDELSTWEIRSSDEGESWGVRRGVSVQRGKLGPTTVIQDEQGRLQLLEARQGDSGRPRLFRTTWNGQQWLPAEDLPLRVDSIADIQVLSAAFRPGNRLDVIYAGVGPRTTDLERVTELNLAERTIQGPAVVAQATTQVSNTATPEPIPTSAATASPIPTADLSPAPSDLGSAGTSPFRMVPPYLGWVIGIFLVGAVAGYFIWRRR
ncbi:MAG: sialidase family protein [Anaerolineales bacterium]